MPVPLRSSSHVKAALTSWPCWNVAPSPGVEIEMLGGGVVERRVRVPLTQIPNALAAEGSGPRSTAPLAMLKR